MNPLKSPDIFTSVAAQLRAAGCVFAEEEAALIVAEAKSEGQLKSMVEQRVSGLPLEHILGWAAFNGERIRVGAGVFVPRRRSEFLIAQAAALTHSRSLVVDLCCGSGALGVALNATVRDLRIYATDIEPVAVKFARRNLTPIGGHVFQGDLFSPLPANLHGKVDILLVNAPYVPTGSIKLLPAEARLHEPLVTLDGGPDGHAIQRRVAEGASSWLAPQGKLFMETSEKQAKETYDIMSRNGLVPTVLRDPELDATVVVATLAAKRERIE